MSRTEVLRMHCRLAREQSLSDLCGTVAGCMCCHGMVPQVLWLSLADLFTAPLLS